MRVARFRGEKNLSELTKRLFAFDDPKAATQAEVGRRLAEANPHLPLSRSRALPKAVEPGTLIVVPDVEGVSPRPSVTSLEEESVTVLLERARTAMEQLRPQLDQMHERAVAQIEETERLVNSPAARSVRRHDKEASSILKDVVAASRARRAQLDRIAARREAALQDAYETATSLLERARGLADR
jgi:hypothetical protein